MNKFKEFCVAHFYDFFSMRFYFTIFTVVEVVAALLIAWSAAKIFDIDLNDSPFYLFAIISICIATSVAVLINSFFLKPIKKLCASMKRVAEGDFSIRLKKHSKVKEIGALNRSFNTMVDELGATEVFPTCRMRSKHPLMRSKAMQLFCRMQIQPKRSARSTPKRYSLTPEDFPSLSETC